MSDPTRKIEELTLHDRADVSKKEAELQARGFMYVDQADGESLLAFEYTIVEQPPETVFDSQPYYIVKWCEG